MNARTLGIIAAGAGAIAVAFAVHFELSARADALNELRGLRAEAVVEVDHHRISPSRAAVLESRLAEVRRQLQDDDVRGAQKLLHRVRDDLRSRTRST